MKSNFLGQDTTRTSELAGSPMFAIAGNSPAWHVFRGVYCDLELESCSHGYGSDSRLFADGRVTY
jgi:hypothetical protein